MGGEFVSRISGHGLGLPKEVEMSETATVEQRLVEVEREVADLKSEIGRLRSKPNWIDQISGSFRDDPEFDEILRLGREIREADRPAGE
jgi:hypothetical protein